MTSEELARERFHVDDVELAKAFHLGPGKLEVWRAKGYMDSSTISIYRKQDGTIVVPKDDLAALGEAIREIRPRLDSPREFASVFDLLVGPDKTEVTAHMLAAKAGFNVSWPEPAYSSGVLVFVASNPFSGLVERYTVSVDYDIKCEILRPAEW
jgi:hypothetical protein